MKASSRLPAALVVAIAIALSLFVIAPTAKAETVDWGFDAPFTDSVDSFGTTIDSSYVFYAGAFNAGGAFTPTRSNTGSWAANWTTFDSTPFNDTTQFFSSSQSIIDNTTFAAGTQAYIWGTNSALGADGEWILLTSSSWLFPTATPIGTATSEWLLTNGGPDLGVTATVGAIDSTYSGSETGISFDASGGDGFDLQTEAVPEPAGALFFSISAIWFLFRRPRRATS